MRRTLTVPPDVYIAIRDLMMRDGQHPFIDFGCVETERIDMRGVMLRMGKEEKKNAPATDGTPNT
jgi:hypothetical protein